MSDIARLLVTHNVVKTNFTEPFTWTSGIKSPIYCDCRELTGLVESRTEIVDALINAIRQAGANVDAVTGTATAGISWAAWVAERLEKPMGYVRSKPKGHGAGKMVEGRLPENASIIVVEDAFSTGGSSIKSAEALRAELNATVTHIFGIFSWDTPAYFDNQKAADLIMVPLTTFDEIASALLETGSITEDEHAKLLKFHQDPEGWQD